MLMLDISLNMCKISFPAHMYAFLVKGVETDPEGKSVILVSGSQ